MTRKLENAAKNTTKKPLQNQGVIFARKAPISLQKACTKCATNKPLSAFSPSSSWCKECRTKAERQRKEKKRELGVKFLRPDRRRVLPRDRYLDPEQWPALIDAVKDERFKLYLDLLQSLGLRANEALQIKPEHIDFDSQEILVASLKRRDSEERPLPVRPDIVRKLREIEYPYFPFSYHTALYRFKKAVEKAGLSKRLGLHSLRHLCATRLREAGASEYDTGYVLRHTNKDITAVYGQAALRRIKKLLETTWESQPKIW